MKKLAIITGHTGGIGSVIADAISSDYDVCGVSRGSGTDIMQWISASERVEGIHMATRGWPSDRAARQRRRYPWLSRVSFSRPTTFCGGTRSKRTCMEP